MVLERETTQGRAVVGGAELERIISQERIGTQVGRLPAVDPPPDTHHFHEAAASREGSIGAGRWKRC